MLIIGSVMGSGIFLVPSVVMREVGGRPLLSLLVWFAGGVLSLLGGLTYGELCARDPEAGGLYIYIRRAFGSQLAFLYGWTLFIVIGSGAVAALTVAFADYLQVVFPFGSSGRSLAVVTAIISIGLINAVGVRQTAILQNWGTFLKIGALLGLATFLICHHGSRTMILSSTPVPLTLGDIPKFSSAVISVLWAYEGWQFCSFSAGEVLDPQRNYPKAFCIGILGLTGLFLLANVSYLAVLGSAAIAGTDSVAVDALKATGALTASKVIGVLLVLSTLSSANGVTAMVTRVYVAMANDGLFFRIFGVLHPVRQTPVRAIALSSLVSIVLALTGSFSMLLSSVVFTGWIFYGGGAATLFVYRQRGIGSEVSFRVPGYPFTPLLFIFCSALVILGTVASEPYVALRGGLFMGCGALVYVIWKTTAEV